MINNTPLYIDLLDYLERDGIASLSNDFDSNAFMTNFDELDTTSPLINNPTVAPTMPYIIPSLGGGDGGDGPRQGLESLIEEDDDVFDYEYDAYGIVDPFSMGVKGSTIHEIGVAAANKERARLQEVARVKAFEEQQRQAQKAFEEKAKEKAQRDAVERMREQNKADGKGGYQSGFDDDFMDGPEGDGGNRGGGSPGSSGPGGSDTMGSH